MRIDATFKGLRHVYNSIQGEEKRQKKSASVAFRAEGYRLMKLLKKQIREGKPGGQKFKGLSFMRRRQKEHKDLWGNSKRMRADRPLRQLFHGVKYNELKNKGGFASEIQIGFVGPLCSNSWKRLAKKHQEGFTHSWKPADRTYWGWAFAMTASKLSKRAKGRKQLFLKKSTNTFKTPKRPIIKPFWDAEYPNMAKNILRNYKLKMAGKWVQGKKKR